MNGCDLATDEEVGDCKDNDREGDNEPDYLGREGLDVASLPKVNLQWEVVQAFLPVLLTRELQFELHEVLAVAVSFDCDYSLVETFQILVSEAFDAAGNLSFEDAPVSIGESSLTGDVHFVCDEA